MAGPWEKYKAQTTAAPVAQPVNNDPIVKARDPYKDAAEQRAARDQQMQEQRFQLEQQRENRQATQDKQGTEAERTAGYLTGRMKDAVGRLTGAAKKDPSVLGPTLGVEAVRGVFGDTAANYLTDADRQIVRAAQYDILDSALTLGTGAAYTKEQIEGYREAYFPKLGDDPATIRSKNEALRQLLVNARIKAGRAAPDVDAAIAALDAINQQKKAAGDGGDTAAYWKDEQGNPVFDENGAPLGPNGGGGFDAQGNYLGLFIGDASFDPRAEAIANERAKTEGQPGATDLARQGLTLGLGDEAAGVGGAIGALLTGNNPVDAYKLENRAQDLRLEQAKKNAGWTGTAAEFLGALSSGGLAAGGATTVRQAAGQGATLGGLYGFGSGEGFANSATNALLGVTLGGGAGAGGQMVANRLGNVIAARQANNAPIQQRTAELADAFAKEGMTINRAIADPNSANRVSGVDASMAGGPRLQAGMRDIERQFEGRVERLGAGGTAMKAEAQGQLIQDAGQRFIKQSGTATKAKYDAAVREAGDTKVEPRESLVVVDEMIAKLSELPNENKAELAYLNGLREDLSKSLSVGALRDLRTTLRKKISKGELTFGQNEERVLEIMGAAADDIRTGLQAAGKGKAAKKFDVADKEYAERMQFIQGTLQKIIGRRNSNVSADQVAKNLAGMARGKDTAGFRNFLQKLTPDELTDVRATFADALGNNGKDGFTVTQFLLQTSERNFPEGSLKVLFGEEGAASIKRLRMMGQEIERVTGAMNSRTSKSAIPGDYRSWLFNVMLGTGGAIIQSPQVIGAAIGVAGIKASRDVLNARALLSSDISKWLASAPRTTNPQAINAHIAKLSGIAAGNSAVRMDAKAIEEYLKSYAASMAQSPGRAAAQDEAPSGGEPPQQ